ncbi:MAG: hypothetical protein K0S93_2242 [Nitrososphaeraceae archaeon]|jgi:hypothetical protein|nr:hypothetical protein [Nitrososphaeraceae archaeon]
MQSLKKKNKEFYLDHIFETNKNDSNYTREAELLQDILKYFKIVEIDNYDNSQCNVVNNNNGKWISLQTKPEVFKIRELENWLMKYNRYFIALYSGSKAKTRIDTRISNNDKQIKNNLKDLESAKLIHIKDRIKGQNNIMETPRYELTIPGLIILIILKYDSDQFSKDKNKTNQIIVRYIQYFFETYNSHICDFLSKIYSEIYVKGYSQLFINEFIKVLHKYTNKINTFETALTITLHSLLMSKETYIIFKNIFLDTLNKLDDEVKKIILYHEKGDIESRIHLSQPTKDWEVLWVQNIDDYSNLTLYGKCKVCFIKYPIMVDYFYYRSNILPSNILIKKCIKCNSENSLIVSSDLNSLLQD